MKLTSRLFSLIALGLSTLGAAAQAGATNSLNFTGKYMLQAKNAPTGGSLLEVVQNPDSIEVSVTVNRRKVTNRYPLGGEEGDYISDGGLPGKCKASLKGKQLILESVVTAHPQPQGPPMREHEKQKWQLSNDQKILTIQTDFDFPDVPSDVSAFVGGAFSGKEKYIRADGNQTAGP